MLKAAIVGASGYAGHQLALLCTRHPQLELIALYVSPNSQDKGRRLDSLYGDMYGRCDLTLQGLSLDDVPAVARGLDVVFLATEHQTAHDEAPLFIQHGCCVFDLSGAYRVPQLSFYDKFYGFSHKHPEWLNQAVYGLCEWCSKEELQQAQLISLPGCYPTASELALKPLYQAQLLDENVRPVINAVSGVSGAGRKASLKSSFCEVSLNAYGLFTHRHQPEISYHVGHEVIFNPHLGNFKRGILATITCRLQPGATVAQCQEALQQAYAAHPLVRVKDGTVRLQDVQGLPCCDLSVCGDDEYIVITSAIDNLLKGAAAQAVQACNLHFGFAEDCALW